MVYIGMSYTVGKLWNPAFQWKCYFWDIRGTRSCIRVHVMGATKKTSLYSLHNKKIFSPVHFSCLLQSTDKNWTSFYNIQPVSKVFSL